ncbi:MAG: exonuclease SbcCD subunit D [Eubacteriales bacterium]|nr:exonuclease SbcCD subunit D [Eubacteriales bacterium]
MKIFHLSDLHIGLKLMNRDLTEDQRDIFDQIVKKAKEEKPDAMVIAGDIYDKSIPSAEAVDLFDEFLSKLHEAMPELPVMMISGNHDSISRVNIYRTILNKQNIHMIGRPPMTEDEFIEKVVLEDSYGKVNFYLLPFVKPSMVKGIVGVDEDGRNLSYDQSVRKLIERENICQEERNVLVSHQFYNPVGSDVSEVERMDSEMRTVGNIDEVKADILERFDYAALGHIHKPMKVGSEFYRYCGTPFPCSVSEAGQVKGIIMVEMGAKGEMTTKVLPLRPLHDVRIIMDTFENVLKEACNDYVSIVLTDEEDLDVIDMQDRIRYAFPNLLEIRRQSRYQTDYRKVEREREEKDPFALCCSFLGDLSEEEKALLEDVIHTVKEVL